jgi:NitT/TauT family transport system substrate-binding protein
MCRGLISSYLTVTIIGVAAFLIFTGACNRKPENSLEPLTYRLKWLFNISVAGELFADVEGYFQAEGLKVTIKEGGPERDAIKELELGHAEFGVASGDQIIRAVSKGAPIIVLAQLFQVNPLQWIYRATDAEIIERPGDLKGKTIGITYGGNDETIMRALLSKFHIAEQEVGLFSVRYDYTPFYEKKVDLWPVYRNAEGIVIGEKLRLADESIRFFSPDEFGIRFVANSVITTQRMLEERPEIVRRFVRALLRGWREAMDPANEDRTLAILQQFDRDTPLQTLKAQYTATRKLIQPNPQIAIGSIDVAAWNQTEQIMREQQLVQEPIRLGTILKTLPGP